MIIGGNSCHVDCWRWAGRLVEVPGGGGGGALTLVLGNRPRELWLSMPSRLAKGGLSWTQYSQKAGL